MSGFRDSSTAGTVRAANRPAFAYAARSQLRHVPVPTAADSLPGDVLSLIFFSEAGDKAALAEQPMVVVQHLAHRLEQLEG